MKIRATLIWEYELPDADLRAITEADENPDGPTDDFVEEAEADFYQNDAPEFISQRLLNNLVNETEIAEHLEHVTRLQVEVVEHASARPD